MTGTLAKVALGLVGTPFRLHGRDPATGLDCVGLVAEAMRRSGYSVVVPTGYSLRSACVEPLLRFAAESGLARADDRPEIVLAMANPVQPHLLIVTDHGFVHAHAGIGKVTVHAGSLPWPITHGWRVDPASQVRSRT